jgi:hypothetical protein
MPAETAPASMSKREVGLLRRRITQGQDLPQHSHMRGFDISTRGHDTYRLKDPTWGSPERIAHIQRSLVS